MKKALFLLLLICSFISSSFSYEKEDRFEKIVSIGNEKSSLSKYIDNVDNLQLGYFSNDQIEELFMRLEDVSCEKFAKRRADAVFTLSSFASSTYLNIDKKTKERVWRKLSQNVENEHHLLDKHIAPDGSIIKELYNFIDVGMAYCEMPANKTSVATEHKTVSERWITIDGEGEIWLKNGNDEQILDLKKGSSILIPVGTKFQFRNVSNKTLKIFILTSPLWPGPDEAILIDDKKW
jgi:mannose-6-phosphate isomerase-like protein (cupin superfamily)